MNILIISVGAKWHGLVIYSCCYKVHENYDSLKKKKISCRTIKILYFIYTVEPLSVPRGTCIHKGLGVHLDDMMSVLNCLHALR